MCVFAAYTSSGERHSKACIVAIRAKNKHLILPASHIMKSDGQRICCHDCAGIAILQLLRIVKLPAVEPVKLLKMDPVALQHALGSLELLDRINGNNSFDIV